MPLDPQARVYLDKMNALQIPGFHTMAPPDARRLFKAMRGLAARPDPVASTSDHQTASGIALRVYRPLGSGPEPLPALVFFHGGGWVLGDIETVENLCRRLANASGGVVVSVDYRLAPETKFPGPLNDCFEATRHVIDQAELLAIDRRRIAVGGDSAGGNLATAVAMMARESTAISLLFQLLIYPITDFSFDRASYSENSEGYGLSRDMMIWYWDQYLENHEDGRSPLASPLRSNNLSGLPPALVITAGYDVLRDEGLAYAERLGQDGIIVQAEHYPGMIHGFLQMADSFDEGKRAIADAGVALRRAYTSTTLSV